jgi:hypothetical protein
MFELMTQRTYLYIAHYEIAYRDRPFLSVDSGKCITVEYMRYT